jgi:hypothetical protein
VIRLAAAVAGLIVLLILAVLLSRWNPAGYTDPAAVVTQVRRLNELATVKYTVQKVVGIREPKYPVGEESILLVVQASVQAGVDLDKLRQEDVRVRRDGSVTVRLPPARILSVAIDEKETRVWDRQKTWWTPWVPFSKDLEQRARLDGIAAAQAAALEMGILRQAQQNAEASIRGLLQLSGARNVDVIPMGAS